MAVSAGTAYLDIVPRLHRTFSRDLSGQMFGPATKAADATGKQAGQSFGKSFAAGTKQGARPVAGVFRQYRGEITALAGAFAAVRVVGFLKGAISEAREAAVVTRQTAAVIKSTGGAAKVSAAQVADLATSISNATGVDDELIQSGENWLLTFKNVRDEAGRGNQVFSRASQAAVDLAASMHQGEVSASGLHSANTLLGKSLNDPLKGMTALAKAGVTFDQGQKDQIKTLVEHGKRLEAQKIILGEVESQVKGFAAASADPWQRLSVTWKNVQEQLGTALLPALSQAATVVGGLAGDFIRLDEATGGLASKGLLAAAGLTAVAVAVSKVTGFVKMARDAWIGYRTAALTTAAANALLTRQQVALGIATAKAAPSFLALAGAVGAYGAAAAAGAYQGNQQYNALKKVGPQVQISQGWYDKLNSTLGTHLGQQQKSTAATKDSALETAYAAKQQESLHLQMVQTIPSMATQADVLALNAKKAEELTGKLKGLKEQFTQQKAAVQQTIQSYDGLIAKSDVTATQVITDLHNQVTNFKTYSADVRRLIKQGVDPAAIRELSEKGPQYIHALATGSAKQLQDYKQTWKTRNAEVRGDFASSMGLQYKELAKTIEHMQNQINRLSGKTIYITAKETARIDRSVRLFLNSVPDLKNFLGGGQHGMRIPGYGGGDSKLIMVEPGEAVVPKEQVRTQGFQSWAKAMGIPGFQLGGLVTARGRLVNATGTVGQAEANIGHSLLKQLAAGVVGAGRGLSWARAHAGAPYLWGGTGPFGWDCSGWISSITQAIRGGNTRARLFSTASFSPGGGVAGFAPGLGPAGGFNIGVFRGNPGHMAGTLRGVNVESSGGRGTQVGGAARGATAGMFGMHFHLTNAPGSARPGGGDAPQQAVMKRSGKAFDRGGWLRPGATLAVNGTGRPERVVGPGETLIDYDRLARAIVKALAAYPLRASMDPNHARQGIKEAQRRGGVPASQQVR